MRVAVIGSRNIKVDISKYVPEKAKEIISGGASGIDSLIEAYADDKKIPKLIIKPEYNRYGKAAPLKRNEIIVEMSDKVVAIWDGKSHGTKYVIDYARKIGKPLEVHFVSEN